MNISRSQLLALLAAAPALTPAGPAVAQAVPLRIGASPTEVASEPVYVAEGGLLSRAGLNAEVMRFTSGGQMIQAVIGGALDIGISDTTQIANANNRGIPLAFFAGGSLYRTESPSTVLCIAQNSPVKNAKDLEGQPIGVNGLKTMAEISAREWLRQGGADPSKLVFVEISGPLAVPALERGTIAAAIVGEPFISAAGDRIRRFGKPYDTIAKNFYVLSWFAKRDWLQQNAPMMRKFVQVVYDTARWANTHHDETAPILAKWLSIEPDAVRATPRTAYATSLDPKLMQPVLDIALRYNLIDKPVEAASLIARLG